MTTLLAGGATDVGRVRSNNQDHLLMAEPLFAVADGMGGHAGGEVASLTAVEALLAGFDANRSADGLADAVRRANEAVWKRAREQAELRGMGTTITALALVDENGEDALAIVNVGDSRAYLFRDGELDQLTDDHSVPKELERAGRLSAEEAAVHPQHNVLTRALGIEPDVEVDCFRVIPYHGDRVLLASDGLFNEVSDGEIATVLRRLHDPDDAARELVTMAKEHGGNDNITVVVVDVVDDGNRSARASAALADEPTAKWVPGAATATARRAGAVEDTRAGGSGPNAPRASAVGDRPTPGPRTAAGTAPAAGYRQGSSGSTEAQADSRRSPPAAAAAPGARSRRVTFRVVVFVVILLLVLGGAAAAVGFYARGSYYVGVDDGEVVVFKGRPGGLLWFKPSVQNRTNLLVGEVRPSRQDDLQRGKVEPSLPAARRYVENLRREVAPPTPPPTAPAPTPA